MRVSVVTHSPWLGGAERCVLEATRALVAAGVPVAVVAPGSGPGVDALREAGAAVAVAPSSWWAWGPGEAPRGVDVAGAARTAAALRAQAPDVVLSSTVVHPAGALAAAALGLPHAWWPQELGDADHGFAFARGIDGTRRAIAALSHALLVPSRTVGAPFAGLVGKARAVALDPWVDVPVAARPPTPGPSIVHGAAEGPQVTPAEARARPARLVCVGRIRPSKGQLDAVRALGRLVATGPDVVLDLWGAGFDEDLEAVRRAAADAGVADRVHLRGEGDAIAAFDAADVVLVPSHFEAVGRVTIEAAKRARPVVGACSGGTAELVEDGVTGLLHPPRDDAALAASIARLLDDPDLRHRLAATAHARATARHTAERHAAGLLAGLGRAVEVHAAGCPGAAALRAA